jgi:phosphatidylglycerophosphate synthase
VLAVRKSSAVGFLALSGLLTALGTTNGLGAAAWAVGLACAAVIDMAVVRGVVRSGGETLSPADLVTLIRAMLSCGVAALTTELLLGRSVLAPLVSIAVVALALDALDGWVARHTRTSSAFGARFDGEVDAFLIGVLSVVVARELGAWVLAIGAMRYVFGVAGWALPWLRRALPFRYWRKVVTAVQGVVLVVVAADVVPRWMSVSALVLALTLLVESFGRDIWWLWRSRISESTVPAGLQVGGLRRGMHGVGTVLALLLMWFALLAPNQLDRFTPSAFLRLPLEGLLVAGLALVLPRWGRRSMTLSVGVLIGLLTLLKLLDIGFIEALGRPFDVVTDRAHFASAFDFVRSSFGSVAAIVAVVGGALVAGGVVICLPLALGRLTALLTRRRNASVVALAGLTAVWVLCATTSLQSSDGEPVASASAVQLAVAKVQAAAVSVREQKRFDAAVAVDAWRDPADGELQRLRGKDVLVVFVESYGRIAVEDSPFSSLVTRTLDDGTRRLHAAGYSARSAFVTSPTFGGVSWLAHSTLQSGVWVTNQRDYDRLLASSRTTLSSAFGRSGWRTVAVLPSNRGSWPDGQAFFGFDEVYDSSRFGYAGPTFGFSRMPDQFALQAFQGLEREVPGRVPLMAEIDLASSHGPWAPLPSMVDWSHLGDGSVFERIHSRAETAEALWSHREDVPAAYMRSIEYSLSTLISFVERYGDDNLVVVLLGDHQPATIVSGHTSNRDVPITVIAHDRVVTDRISAWGWTAGMRPGPNAPVWRMDAFRDRFLTAYSSPPGSATDPVQATPDATRPPDHARAVRP